MGHSPPGREADLACKLAMLIAPRGPSHLWWCLAPGWSRQLQQPEMGAASGLTGAGTLQERLPRLRGGLLPRAAASAGQPAPAGPHPGRCAEPDSGSHVPGLARHTSSCSQRWAGSLPGVPPLGPQPGEAAQRLPQQPGHLSQPPPLVGGVLAQLTAAPGSCSLLLRLRVCLHAGCA